MDNVVVDNCTLRKKYRMLMKFFNPPENYLYRQDIIAGITVGIITIPQAMAFALLAGLPPIYGLYGALIPLVVYALFGTSNYLNVGPVSVISIFVYDSLTPFVDPFTPEFIIAVVNLGLLIGLIQVLSGLFQLGRFVNYLPKSVVSGFVQAAAVVIIISQLSPAFGVPISSKVSYAERLYQLGLSVSDFNLFTTELFIGSLLLLFIAGRFVPQFPTAIVLLLTTGISAYFFDFESLGIALIGEVPQGLPTFISPKFNQDFWRYIPSAFGIAFVTSIGSFVMAKNVEDQQSSPWKPNQDLIALGLTKIASAFFGSLVPAGSFNRSILVIKSGAKTQLASLVAAVILLFTLLFLTPIVYYLPQSVIAAIIVYSVCFLFDFPLILHFWTKDKKQFTYLFATAVTTLSIGFVEGILLGLVIVILGQNFFNSKKSSSF